MRAQYPISGTMYVGQRVPGSQQHFATVWSGGRTELSARAGDPPPEGLWGQRLEKPGVTDALRTAVASMAEVYNTASTNPAGRQVACYREKQLREAASEVARLALVGERFGHFHSRDGEEKIIANQVVDFAAAVFVNAGVRDASKPFAERQIRDVAQHPRIKPLLEEVSPTGDGLTPELMRAVGLRVTVDELSRPSTFELWASPQVIEVLQPLIRTLNVRAVAAEKVASRNTADLIIGDR